MKLPLLEVSAQAIILSLFSLLTISGALPVRDDVAGGEAYLWQNAVRKFYGPWSEVHKLNGEYADYGDYGAHVQDFETGPEDVPADEPEVAEAGPADFQSNYGDFESDESSLPFQPPSGDDQSASDHDDGDQIAGGDPENHDLEGNVQWTSAAV